MLTEEPPPAVPALAGGVLLVPTIPSSCEQQGLVFPGWTSSIWSASPRTEDPWGFHNEFQALHTEEQTTIETAFISYFPSTGSIAGTNSKMTEIKDFFYFFFSGTVLTTGLSREHVKIVCSLDPTCLLFTPIELAWLIFRGLPGRQESSVLPVLPTSPLGASGDISGLFNPGPSLCIQSSQGQHSDGRAFFLSRSSGMLMACKEQYSSKKMGRVAGYPYHCPSK